MPKQSLRIALFTLIVVVIFVTSFAVADPLPGENTLKFQQLPLDVGLPPNANFPGHDEPSTAYSIRDPQNNIIGYQGRFMADDFADKFSSPIFHIRWWGSYANNNLGDDANGRVQDFLISIESDVPASPNNPFSHPGTPLSNQILSHGPLAPGSRTYTEKLINGATTEHLYEYNGELALDKRFPQKPDTVYWLKIVALTDNHNVLWGWHDRDWSVTNPLASSAPAVSPGESAIGTIGAASVYHFQDDAVSGNINITQLSGVTGPIDVTQDGYEPNTYVDNIDGPHGISQFSKDLAFELYTTNVPEPASYSLFAAMGTLLLRRRGAQKSDS